MGLINRKYMDVVLSQNNQHKEVKKKGFQIILVSFLLQIFISLIVSLLFYSIDNTNWYWGFVCLPVLFIYQFIWFMSRKLLFVHTLERYYNCFFFLLFFALFAFSYFICFYQIFIPKYDDAQNCQAISSIQFPITDASDSEIYTVLGVKFNDKDGNSKYGCACQSTTRKQDVFFDEPSPYVYIHKGKQVGTKRQEYNKSQVKIASWKCSAHDKQLSDFNQDSCYYRFYEDDVFPQEVDFNGNQDSLLQSYCLKEDKFYEIMYEKPPGYYQKLIFILTICLPYYAMFGFGLNEITVFLAYYIMYSTFKDKSRVTYPSPFIKNNKKLLNFTNIIADINLNRQNSYSSEESEFTNEIENLEFKGVNSSDKNSKKIQQSKLNKVEDDVLKNQRDKTRIQDKFEKKLKLQQEKKIKKEKEKKLEQQEEKKKLKQEQEYKQSQIALLDKVKQSKLKKKQKTKINPQDYSVQQEKNGQLKQQNKTKKLNSQIQLPSMKYKSSLNQSQTPNNKIRKKKLTTNEEYDPNKIPADLDQAIEHGRAWTVGSDNNSKKSKKQLNLCECCGRQIEKQPFDLSCDLPELSYLGAGYPQYFYFIRFSIFILFIIFLISGIYGTYTNLEGDDCIDVDSVPLDQRDEICHLNWITMSSLGNKHNNDEQMNTQQVLNFITIIIVIISLQLFRRQIRITHVECDQLDINSSDYTILVKNIPRNFLAKDYDNEIQNLFELAISKLIYKNQVGKKLKIEKISLCYDTTQQNNVELEKLQLIKKKKQFIKENQDVKEIDRKLQELERKQDEIEQDFIQGQSESTKKLFSGWAFVSFKTEQEKNEVIYFFGEQPPTIFFCCQRQKKRRIRFKQNQLRVQQAPDCNDVYWENLHYTGKQKFKRRVIGKIILLFTLILCLSIITGLKYLQKLISNQDNPNSNDIMISQVFAILIGGGITMFNKALQFTFQSVSKYEKYSTRTEEILNVAKGLTVAQFFITGLLTFLVDILLTDIFSDNTSFSLIFRTGGLAYNIYFVFFTNAFVEPIINYINFPYLLKKFQRYQIEKQEAENHVDGKSLQQYTQSELNKLYENPQPQLSYLYASVIKTMYFTAFYCVLQPLGTIISIIGLILTYYVEKYNILRKRTIKFSISQDLCIEMTEMIEHVIIIYSASNWIFFTYVLNQNVPILCTIGFAISVANAIMPMQQINEFLFPIDEAEELPISYEKAMFNFETDYARENPATKQFAKQQFYQKVEKLKKHHRP